MISITIRNIKLYFRDKVSVFFSLLGALIIIGLYLLFLGNNFKSSMGELQNVDNLLNNWILSGVLAVVSITTIMGAFGTMVNDKENKRIKDFIASPLKTNSIVAGYVISSYIVGVIMCLVSLFVFELYIFLSGGELLSLIVVIKVIGIILLAVMTNSAMIYFFTTFIKTENAFGTASTVLGTLIGFLTGAYIPIGEMPELVQTIIKIFPPSHAGLLFRKIILESPIATSFQGVPIEYIREFEEQMGLVFMYGDYEITTVMSILFLIGTAIVFFLLSVVRMSKKQVD